MNKLTQIGVTSAVLTLSALLLALFLFSGATVLAQSAGGGGGSSTTTPETVDLELTKKFSGDPNGYTESQFSFKVTGGSVDTTVSHGGSVSLEVGTYTIEELVPDGFVKGAWRPGWFGACDGGSDYSTTVTIDDGNVDHGTLYCEVDNQYRPALFTIVKEVVSDDGGTAVASDFSFTINGTDETQFDVSGSNILELPPGTYTIAETAAPGYTTTYSGCENIELGFDESAQCRITNDDIADDNGGGGGNGDNATITVVKVINGTSTSPENFSFQVNDGTPEAFESDGSNDVEVEPGIYSVTEVSIDGYEVSYDNCTGLELIAGDTATCTITNAYDDDGGNGGGGGGNGTSTDLYRLEGYVWHDLNKNGEWEQEDENPLSNWVIVLEQDGVVSATTTSDVDGYYFFDVEAGTWTLYEVVQTSWTQVFPGDPQSYTITVPEEEPQLTLWFPLNLFVNVAHAAVVETYSDINFGNFFTGDSGGGGNGGNGGNGGGSGSSGGGSGSSGGSSGGGGGTPQVLGDQVAVVPAGAPNAGFGGADQLFSLTNWLREVWSWFRLPR